MLQSVWLFVGFVAAVATLVAVSTNDNGIAIVSGTLGFITWGIWTFGSLNVEVVTDSGSTIVFSSAPVTILGVVLALIPGFIALTGPVEIVSRVRDTRPKQV